MEVLLHSPEVAVFLAAEFLAAVIWAIRQEGVIRQERAMREVQIASLATEDMRLRDELKEVKEKQEAVDLRVATDVEEIKVQLAEIKGFLSHIFKERHQN